MDVPSDHKNYIIELFALPLQLPPRPTQLQRVAALNILSKKVKSPLVLKLALIKECTIVDLEATYFTVIISASEKALVEVVKLPEVRMVILDKHHK